MDMWKVCNICRVKFPYANFYRLDGCVHNTCQFCTYGLRVYDAHGPDVYMAHLDLQIAEQLDRVRKAKETNRPCNYNKIDEIK